MTKQILLFRIEGAIDQTKRDIRRAAELARKYRKEKETAFATGGNAWMSKHQVASNLEGIYEQERDAYISQLRMLKGLVR